MSERSSCEFDLEPVASWMESQGLGEGPICDVQSIGGGSQNVMLSFVRGNRPFVFRRGPRHVRAATNESLRREMRILSALADTAVPHPRLIAGCADEAVLGDSVFYLMEPVNGFNAATQMPPEYAADPSKRHGLGLAAVDALVVLHDVDYRSVGLADFGRPDGFLERQVLRWLGELESYSKLDGYAGPKIPGLGRVVDWLEAHRPARWHAGLMHGDYHFANVMFDPGRPVVAAIVDWEMCTIGDPLLDVGWWLALWPHPGEREPIAGGPVVEAGGLATPAELIERYAASSQRDVSEVTWYTVLASFKLGIVLEGTYARACAGKAPRAMGDRLHAMTLALFDRAHALTAGTLALK